MGVLQAPLSQNDGLSDLVCDSGTDCFVTGLMVMANRCQFPVRGNFNAENTLKDSRGR